eukprot:5606842-Pleurochrysis_carterae.AAC.3
MSAPCAGRGDNKSCCARSEDVSGAFGAVDDCRVREAAHGLFGADILQCGWRPLWKVARNRARLQREAAAGYAERTASLSIVGWKGLDAALSNVAETLPARTQRAS